MTDTLEITVKLKAKFSTVIDEEGIDEFPGDTRNDKLKNILLYLFEEEGLFSIVDDEYELIDVKEV
jgi:hypothetical protein